MSQISSPDFRYRYPIFSPIHLYLWAMLINKSMARPFNLLENWYKVFNCIPKNLSTACVRPHEQYNVVKGCVNLTCLPLQCMNLVLSNRGLCTDWCWCARPYPNHKLSPTFRPTQGHPRRTLRWWRHRHSPHAQIPWQLYLAAVLQKIVIRHQFNLIWYNNLIMIFFWKL